MERPKMLRRSAYVTDSPQEQFIVPLIREGVERHIRRLTKPAERSIKVLDVGCGGQPFRALLEGCGARYLSMDVVPQDGVAVDFQFPIDGPELPPDLISAGLFDLILCTEVLEHVAEWDQAFLNLSELVHRGGHVVLTVPHFFPSHEVPYDFWRPTPYAVAHFAQKHGFVVETSELLGTGWDVMGTLIARQSYSRATDQITSGVVTVMSKAMRRLMFWMLRKRVLQRLVKDNGPYYIGNLHVLIRSK